jgi:ubiquinol-cytochrome c reductase cytochrome c subunit
VRHTLALVVLIALGLTACDYSTFNEGPYRPAIVAAAGEPSSGRDLYLRDCAWCHGARGEGTPRGPDLLTGTNGPALTDFMLRTGRMPLDAPLDRSTQRPPAYESAEIDAIVSYVASFGQPGPDVPTPQPEFGDLGLGQVLYAENCAACHSTTLIGGALTNRPTERRTQNAPDVRSSTALEIEEAMLTGPGPMPVFGPDTFTPHEVDSIVRHVLHQQNPNDRGGAPLGHVGPVTEGAAAWILGLGLLLVVCRWIGTKTGER